METLLTAGRWVETPKRAYRNRRAARGRNSQHDMKKRCSGGPAGFSGRVWISVLGCQVSHLGEKSCGGSVSGEESWCDRKISLEVAERPVPSRVFALQNPFSSEAEKWNS